MEKQLLQNNSEKLPGELEKILANAKISASDKNNSKKYEDFLTLIFAKKYTQKNSEKYIKSYLSLSENLGKINQLPSDQDNLLKISSSLIESIKIISNEKDVGKLSTDEDESNNENQNIITQVNKNLLKSSKQNRIDDFASVDSVILSPSNSDQGGNFDTFQELLKKETVNPINKLIKILEHDYAIGAIFNDAPIAFLQRTSEFFKAVNKIYNSRGLEGEYYFNYRDAQKAITGNDSNLEMKLTLKDSIEGANLKLSKNNGNWEVQFINNNTNWITENKYLLSSGNGNQDRKLSSIKIEHDGKTLEIVGKDHKTNTKKNTKKIKETTHTAETEAVKIAEYPIYLSKIVVEKNQKELKEAKANLVKKLTGRLIENYKQFFEWDINSNIDEYLKEVRKVFNCNPSNPGTLEKFIKGINSCGNELKTFQEKLENQLNEIKNAINSLTSTSKNEEQKEIAAAFLKALENANKIKLERVKGEINKISSYANYLKKEFNPIFGVDKDSFNNFTINDEKRKAILAKVPAAIKFDQLYGSFYYPFEKLLGLYKQKELNNHNSNVITKLNNLKDVGFAFNKIQAEFLDSILNSNRIDKISNGKNSFTLNFNAGTGSGKSYLFSGFKDKKFDTNLNLDLANGLKYKDFFEIDTRTNKYKASLQPLMECLFSMEENNNKEFEIKYLNFHQSKKEILKLLYGISHINQSEDPASNSKNYIINIDEASDYWMIDNAEYQDKLELVKKWQAEYNQNKENTGKVVMIQATATPSLFELYYKEKKCQNKNDDNIQKNGTDKNYNELGQKISLKIKSLESTSLKLIDNLVPKETINKGQVSINPSSNDINKDNSITLIIDPSLECFDNSESFKKNDKWLGIFLESKNKKAVAVQYLNKDGKKKYYCWDKEGNNVVDNGNNELDSIPEQYLKNINLVYHKDTYIGGDFDIKNWGNKPKIYIRNLTSLKKENDISLAAVIRQMLGRYRSFDVNDKEVYNNITFDNKSLEIVTNLQAKVPGKQNNKIYSLGQDKQQPTKNLPISLYELEGFLIQKTAKNINNSNIGFSSEVAAQLFVLLQDDHLSSHEIEIAKTHFENEFALAQVLQERGFNDLIKDTVNTQNKKVAAFKKQIDDARDEIKTKKKSLEDNIKNLSTAHPQENPFSWCGKLANKEINYFKDVIPKEDNGVVDINYKFSFLTKNNANNNKREDLLKNGKLNLNLLLKMPRQPFNNNLHLLGNSCSDNSSKAKEGIIEFHKKFENELLFDEESKGLFNQLTIDLIDKYNSLIQLTKIELEEDESQKEKFLKIYNKINSLKKELNAARDADEADKDKVIKELSEQIAKFSESFNKALNDLSSDKGKEELLNKIAKLEKELNDQPAKNKSGKEELDKLTQEIKEKETELNTELNKLKEKLKKSESENKELLEEKNKALKALEKKLEAAELKNKELNNLTNKIEEKNKAFESKKEELLKKITELEALDEKFKTDKEADELQKEKLLEEKNNALKESEAKFKAAELEKGKLDKLTKEIEGKNKALEALEKKLEAAELEKEELNKLKNEIEENNKAFESKNEELLKTITELKALEKKLEAAESEKEELNKLKNEIEEKKLEKELNDQLENTKLWDRKLNELNNLQEKNPLPKAPETEILTAKKVIDHLKEIGSYDALQFLYSKGKMILIPDNYDAELLSKVENVISSLTDKSLSGVIKKLLEDKNFVGDDEGSNKRFLGLFKKSLNDQSKLSLFNFKEDDNELRNKFTEVIKDFNSIKKEHPEILSDGFLEKCSESIKEKLKLLLECDDQSGRLCIYSIIVTAIIEKKSKEIEEKGASQTEPEKGFIAKSKEFIKDIHNFMNDNEIYRKLFNWISSPGGSAINSVKDFLTKDIPPNSVLGLILKRILSKDVGENETKKSEKEIVKNIDSDSSSSNSNNSHSNKTSIDNSKSQTPTPDKRVSHNPWNSYVTGGNTNSPDTSPATTPDKRVRHNPWNSYVTGSNINSPDTSDPATTTDKRVRHNPWNSYVTGSNTNSPDTSDPATSDASNIKSNINSGDIDYYTLPEFTKELGRLRNSQSKNNFFCYVEEPNSKENAQNTTNSSKPEWRINPHLVTRFSRDNKAVIYDAALSGINFGVTYNKQKPTNDQINRLKTINYSFNFREDSDQKDIKYNLKNFISDISANNPIIPAKFNGGNLASANILEKSSDGSKAKVFFTVPENNKWPDDFLNIRYIHIPGTANLKARVELVRNNNTTIDGVEYKKGDVVIHKCPYKMDGCNFTKLDNNNEEGINALNKMEISAAVFHGSIKDRVTLKGIAVMKNCEVETKNLNLNMQLTEHKVDSLTFRTPKPSTTINPDPSYAKFKLKNENIISENIVA